MEPLSLQEKPSSDEQITAMNRILDDDFVIDEEIIGLESGDILSRIELRDKYRQVRHLHTDSFYSDLIFILTNIRLDEKTAEQDWKDILMHKHLISEKLGRNVGIRVASLDYYTNIRKQMQSPKIIDMKEYTNTVKASITDPLTCCYNRRYFDYIIRHYFVVAKESDSLLSLCMLDADFFKTYNDQNGHIAGDLALMEISRILNAVTRKADVVARYGGEEFAILMPQTALQEAFEQADNLRRAVEDFRFPKEQLLPGKRLTVSIGVAELTTEVCDHISLVKRADEALYSAKLLGRNRVVRYGSVT